MKNTATAEETDNPAWHKGWCATGKLDGCDCGVADDEQPIPTYWSETLQRRVTIPE